MRDPALTPNILEQCKSLILLEATLTQTDYSLSGNTDRLPASSRNFFASFRHLRLSANPASGLCRDPNA